MDDHAGAPSAACPDQLSLDLRRSAPCAAAGWRDFLHRAYVRAVLRRGLCAGRLAFDLALTAQGQSGGRCPRRRAFPSLAPSSPAGFTRSAAGASRVSRWALAEVLGVSAPEGPADPVDGGGDRGVLPVLELPVAHDLCAVHGAFDDDQCRRRSLSVFLTPNGMMMLAVGTAVGAVFATLLLFHDRGQPADAAGPRGGFRDRDAHLFGTWCGKIRW
jgi:hypothetical protein